MKHTPRHKLAATTGTLDFLRQSLKKPAIIRPTMGHHRRRAAGGEPIITPHHVTDTFTDPSSGTTTQTWSAKPVGAATADRTTFVFIGYNSNTYVYSNYVSAVTVGGTSATELGFTTILGGGNRIWNYIYGCNIADTGTTMDVVVTHPYSIAYDIRVCVATFLNVASLSVYDTDSTTWNATNPSQVDLSINTQENGLVLMSWFGYWCDGTGWDSTATTIDFNNTGTPYSGAAYATETPAATGDTYSLTLDTGGSPNKNTLMGISLL